MVSVRFQGKPFNITIIQVYAPTTNAEEDEVEWFCEDLQDLLELTPQKDRTLKDELPRLVGAQYAGNQWKNNSRKNEETEPKQKQHTVVDVTGDASKV